MAGSGSSMLYSLLLFIVTLSLQEMYRGKLASTELFTILGGFTSSLLFLFLLTFIGNYQETSGIKTGWGAVILAEAVALVAAGTVHRVCITTWKHLQKHQQKTMHCTGSSQLVYSSARRRFPCIPESFLFSAALLYEVNKISGIAVSKSEPKSRRY